MSIEGSLLCSAELNADVKDTLLCAVASSTYSNSLQSVHGQTQQGIDQPSCVNYFNNQSIKTLLVIIIEF
jgi:hypothetical protein